MRSKMNIALIAAMANNRVIGLDNQMPWHLPADLQHFKAVTLGKPVIMGRKTYQSIGKALPGRRNIVISRGEAQSSDAQWVSSIDEALSLTADAEEVMIIGGAEIYRQALPLASRLYLTFIDLTVSGDAYFPDYLSVAQWRQTDAKNFSPDNKNVHSYQFVTLERE